MRSNKSKCAQKTIAKKCRSTQGLENSPTTVCIPFHGNILLHISAFLKKLEIESNIKILNILIFEKGVKWCKICSKFTIKIPEKRH